MTNRVKDKLAASQPTTIIAPYATSAGLVEMLGHFGFDGVFLDCEHGPASWEEVEHMVRAAELAGYTSVVRVQDHEAATITRALDRGADGIQVPHVNTAAEAAAIVEHAKYAPLGHRGWSGWRGAYGVDASDYARQANDSTLVVIMLEEVEALNNLDDILRVEQSTSSSSLQATWPSRWDCRARRIIRQCRTRSTTRCATSRAPAACQARSRRRERSTTTWSLACCSCTWDCSR